MYRKTIVALGCALLIGCSYIQKGRIAIPAYREGDIERAVETLGTRQTNLENFKARVTFIIDSPDLEKQQKFRGNVAVEMPDRLRLVSTGAFGRKLFDLVSVGKSFLLHFPSEQKVFFEKEGMPVESLPFSVSPSDIVKELFGPEDWGNVDLANVRVLSPGGRRLVVALYSGGVLKRKLWIQRPEWLLVRDELYAEDGTLRAVTVLDRYRRIQETWMPTRFEAQYPLHETYMVMNLGRIEINTGLNPRLFVFPEKLLLMAQRQREQEG
jgi:outer membrane lipoprotein-sorting protein